MNFISKAYQIFVRVASSLKSPFLLLMRLYWGWNFFEGGWGKFQHLEKTANFFSNIHIPMPYFNAIMAASVECAGGLLLLMGLFSRVAAFPLVITMVVAYTTAHRDALTGIFKKPEDFVEAPPFLYLLAALVVLIFGPGRFSIDYLFKSKLPKALAEPES